MHAREPSNSSAHQYIYIVDIYMTLQIQPIIINYNYVKLKVMILRISAIIYI